MYNFSPVCACIISWSLVTQFPCASLLQCVPEQRGDPHKPHTEWTESDGQLACIRSLKQDKIVDGTGLGTRECHNHRFMHTRGGMVVVVLKFYELLKCQWATAVCDSRKKASSSYCRQLYCGQQIQGHGWLYLVLVFFLFCSCSVSWSLWAECSLPLMPWRCWSTSMVLDGELVTVVVVADPNWNRRQKRCRALFFFFI